MITHVNLKTNSLISNCQIENDDVKLFKASCKPDYNRIKELKPLHTQQEYEAALAEVEPYFDKEPKPGSKKAIRFELLVLLIEAYETRHVHLPLPDPIDAIKFRMEQQGLTPRDLQPMIGGLNRVYEILNRKRPLTLRMIWALHDQLGIPAESLITPPEVLEAA